MLRGHDQSPTDPNRSLFSERGSPHYRKVTEAQMQAYYVWCVASVCCFCNSELNYLRVLFELPMRSLVRDCQRAQVRTAFDKDIEYYAFDRVGDDGVLLSPNPYWMRENILSRRERVYFENFRWTGVGYLKRFLDFTIWRSEYMSIDELKVICPA